MIVLNNTKELIDIERWEDIESLPGFTNNLNPEFQKLEAIIGKYHFRDKIQCGLSNCHTQHAKGYIVATEDGRVTNIGKDCGRKYFGVDFDKLSAQFDRDFTEKKYREQLWAFKSKLEQLKHKISEIRDQPHGAKWVYTMLERLFKSEHVPEEIGSHINSMAKSGEYRLYTDRQATKQEVENLEAATNKKIPLPHYFREPFAEIAGMNALLPENNLRNLMTIELEEKIKVFESMNIDSMNFKTLGEWVKWVEQVPVLMKRAITSLKSGQLLLTQENLAPFSQRLLQSSQKSSFQKYLKSLI